VKKNEGSGSVAVTGPQESSKAVETGLLGVLPKSGSMRVAEEVEAGRIHFQIA